MTEKPHPAAVEVAGSWCLYDAKGRLVPMALVKPVDLLMDELVRSILADAREESERVAAFRRRTFERVGDFQALLAQQYGASIGGKKGNVTLPTIDGCGKVQIAVADVLDLGPELQVAKQLIDECLAGWVAGSRDEIRAIVNQAFSVEKEGQINRSGLFMLLRVAIEDEQWQRAMEAIRESMRIVGSKQYVRFYDRPAADAAWRGITIDIAAG